MRKTVVCDRSVHKLSFACLEMNSNGFFICDSPLHLGNNVNSLQCKTIIPDAGIPSPYPDDKSSFIRKLNK